MVIIKKASSDSIEDLSKLALELWPENELADLQKDFTYILGHLNDRVLLAEIDGKNVGFIHISIRKDYVEGSSSNPVGYIEGLYVKPEYRKQKIGTRLYEEGVKWVKSRGCREIGSDCTLDNDLSYDFHYKMGFKEANRIICFIKEI